MSEKPFINRATGSLWTGNATGPGAEDLAKLTVDPSVTREDIRGAVANMKARLATFSGRVSDESLRVAVE